VQARLDSFKGEKEEVCAAFADVVQVTAPTGICLLRTAVH
jgi:hypothetical protein